MRYQDLRVGKYYKFKKEVIDNIHFYNIEREVMDKFYKPILESSTGLKLKWKGKFYNRGYCNLKFEGIKG
jgi:hypothetical protein